MLKNEPSDQHFFDGLRLQALETWASTVRRTRYVDSDILNLACIEAYRRQKGLSDLGSWKADRTQMWATWQAIRYSSAQKERGTSLSNGIAEFAERLEEFLKELRS